MELAAIKRILLLFVCFISLTHTVDALADMDCRRCHSGTEAKNLGLSDVYAGIESYRFRHNNVGVECKRCHIIEELQIRNKGELYFPGSVKEGVFFLKGLSVDIEYEVELIIRDQKQGVLHTKVFKLTPSRVVVEKGDGAPPVVTAIKFLGIKEGIIPEGVLYFETDRPAISVVEYWKEEAYLQRVLNLKVFVREHLVRLSGIKGKGRYRYRIIVMDVFGNRSITEGVLFADGRKATTEAMGSDREDVPLSEPSIKVFRPSSYGDLCFKVEADRPVMVSVSMQQIVGTSRHGYGLQNARYTTIGACLKCHRAGLSHPVGVRSTRSDIEVPKDMPTIEGGVITCVTCHLPHGGNTPYLARFDFDGLCNRCHRDMQ